MFNDKENWKNKVVIVKDNHGRPQGAQLESAFVNLGEDAVVENARKTGFSEEAIQALLSGKPIVGYFTQTPFGIHREEEFEGKNEDKK